VLALVQPFGSDDESVHDLISNVEHISVHASKRAVRILSESGLLYKRSGKYRLSPDMLADFILEKNCIADGGKSTGFAEEVFDHCRGVYTRNLLVNLGKLDWRLTVMDGRASKLMDGVWRKLEPSRKYSDPHIAAVSAVAFYQPDRALAF